jgi:hypothetical protein
MKNVTITLDEAVLRWARIKAAEQETSVSRLVSELLETEMKRADAGDRAWQDYLARAPRHPISDGTPYPKREALYDRPVLRRYERPDLREGPKGFGEDDTRPDLARRSASGRRRRAKPSGSR